LVDVYLASVLCELQAKVMYHILDEMLANKCVKEADQILPLHWEA